MKLGLFVDTHWEPGADPAQRLADLLEQARTARDSGFDSLWLPQHFLTGPGGMFQPLPLIARLAPEMPGMRLATGILLLPFANPIQLAEDAATLDWLCDGRLMLGVGMGYVDKEFEAFHTPKKERVGRLVEHITIMRKLWSGEPVHHEGRTVTLDGQRASVRPKQPGGIPILIGASNPKAIERAAKVGDGWLITAVTPFETLREQLALFRSARAAAGLPPAAEQTLGRECYVGSSTQAAYAEASGPLMARYAGYSNAGFQGLGGSSAEAFFKDRCIVGDEAFAREEMARYAEELGIDLLRLRMQWQGLSQADTLRSIERAGRAARA